MRYIITPTQAHSLIYKFLDSMFSNNDFRKKINPYVEDGNTWTIDLFDEEGERNLITYFWYGPGEYDDGNPHNGVGNLQIHPDVVDTLRKNLSLRESKVLDVIADWVSEKLEVDIDEISIYPYRKGSPNY